MKGGRESGLRHGSLRIGERKVTTEIDLLGGTVWNVMIEKQGYSQLKERFGILLEGTYGVAFRAFFYERSFSEYDRLSYSK